MEKFNNILTTELLILLIIGTYFTDFLPTISRKIYENYAGDKNVIIVDGDHNSQRPSFLYDSALIFLVHVLQVKFAN